MARPNNTCACGAEFEQSPANTTVNCPSCRRRERTKPVSAWKSPTVLCGCGKTVIVDGFGTKTRQTCPRAC
jgi:hypothetical protein